MKALSPSRVFVSARFCLRMLSTRATVLRKLRPERTPVKGCARPVRERVPWAKTAPIGIHGTLAAISARSGSTMANGLWTELGTLRSAAWGVETSFAASPTRCLRCASPHSTSAGADLAA